ncbi:STAS domain-containing protein [Asanoa sp. WMMD1127]|uniref:STAS domain-containing protein n=1 Tax=Asanoa sp. WMMD1127 TaxID=3016107 RepID=UPI0024159FA0|nr:STAS domain-containing protein [Asanoa sp. WMMD1127]MDG4825815.1 STAS domain-containing protein [Asanoa sp. WMMD1127]
MRQFRTYVATPVPAGLQVSLERRHPLTTVVTVVGEVDMDVLEPLEDALARVLPARPGATVEVDLTGVTFMDASGISALLRCRKQVKDAGLTFLVRNPQPLIYRMLLLCGLVDTLDVQLAGD